MTLSKGSTMSGSIFVNKRQVKKADFGKFGAFVQQDDILISTMTPREALTFAYKMTSSNSIN